MGGEPHTGGTSTAGLPDFLGAVLEEAGETGRLLGSSDWRSSGLGPPGRWPKLLRTALKLCLSASGPRLLWWGGELVSFYNDHARALFGGRHPRAFGRPAREQASALWSVLGRSVEHVAATAEPIRSENQLLFLDRRGRTEECYFSFTYSPLLDEHGVAGVFCVAEETTLRVLASRRRRTLARLAEVAVAAASEGDAWRRSLACLERNPADLPFALLYRVEDDPREARLAAAVGIVPGSGLAPERVPLTAPGETVWPLAQVTREQAPVPAPGAFVLPVTVAGGGVRGLLVAGLNPRQPFEDAYRGFLEEVAERLAAAVASAEAREAVVRRAAELERAQTALAKRCAELNGIIEQAPVPIVVTRGPSFVVTVANAAARRSSDGREILERPLFEALPELGAQGFDATLREVLRLGEVRNGQEVHVRLERGGEVRDTYFTFIAAPMRNASAEINGVIVIANEVTAQVLARDAIQASEARYRSIFDTVDVSIWEEDFSAVKAFLRELEAAGVADIRAYAAERPSVLREALERVKVVDVNPATLRLFGARDKEQLLASLPAILTGEALGVFGEKLAAVAENRRVLESDVAVRTLAGERREVMMTMAMPPGDRDLRRVLVTLADITDRKRMEQALREADRRKDEFLATLAHELRNPLAPLRNCVELLRVGERRPAQPAVLDIVARQVEHLVRLVDDLLETSRISRGAFELRRERVPLASVVRNALETSEQLIHEAGHFLDVELPEEPVWLDGDPVRLAQILGNVLNNAAKYTPSGGRVSLHARREGQQAVVTIADTGIGIAPEELPRLFTLFNRLGGGSAGPGGLGIGLALAKRLAEMHGGTLEGHSDGLGKGSEFTLRLPVAADGEGTEAAVGARPRATLDQKRIIVVDDNHDAADTLGMLLRAAGADVRVAYGGAQALEAFAVQDPQIALLDIGMPGMDGYELARRVRAEFPDRSTVLVALTGWGQEHDRQRAREAGFDHHLVKPADIGALQALIDSLEQGEAHDC